MKQRIVLQQERDFGSKINATFTFIKQEFKPLFTCLVYIVLPLALLSGIAYGMFNASLFSSQDQDSAYGLNKIIQMSNIFSGIGLLYIFLSIVSHIFLFSAVISYLKIYKTGQEIITPSDVWAESIKHIPMVFVLWIVNYILIVISLVLLIIPGIYVSIVLSLSIYILILEEGTLQHAIVESFSIIKGKWWSTFGLIFILGLIAGVISMFFSIPTTIYSTTRIFSTLEPDPLISSVLGVIYFIGIHLVYVILIVGIAFQYFNLNERKYANRLIHDIDAIGQNTEE